MEEKLNKTIENICDWINDRLNDSMILDEVEPTAIMVSALSDLVASRADSDLEKRVADLEVQVQSQQKIDVALDTTNTNTYDLIIKQNHERQSVGII